MAMDRIVTLVCPAELVEAGNHLVNCFESCMPSAPVLNLSVQDAQGNQYAVISVPCRASWLEAVQAIAQGQSPLIEPEWNTASEAGMLIDMAKAQLALDAVSVCTGEEAELPEGILLIPNMLQSEVCGRFGLTAP
jgi:hypothetical protein